MSNLLKFKKKQKSSLQTPLHNKISKPLNYTFEFIIIIGLAILFLFIKIFTTTVETDNCGIKYYCKEMADCAEAQYYFEQCGLSRLDGDNDGIPCEALCR